MIWRTPLATRANNSLTILKEGMKRSSCLQQGQARANENSHEAQVDRLVESRLKQKAGYGQLAP